MEKAKLTLMEIFHINNDTTFMICKLETNKNIPFSSKWNVFIGSVYYESITFKGIVMDGVSLETRTFCLDGLLDKKIYNKHNAITLIEI